MPLLMFECRVVYMTRAGYQKTATIRLQAIAADIAMKRAIERVQADQRRSVAAVLFAQAVEC